MSLNHHNIQARKKYQQELKEEKEWEEETALGVFQQDKGRSRRNW